MVQDLCTAAGGAYSDLSDLFINPANRGPEGRSTWTGTSDDFYPNDAGYTEIMRRIGELVTVR